MSDELKENIKDQGTWLRALYILMFAIVYMVTEIVIALVVLFQFLFVLFTRKSNDKLLVLGANLSTFIYQILCYVTFNSDQKPFPFDDFPTNAASNSSEVKRKRTVKKKADSKKITTGENNVNDAD